MNKKTTLALPLLLVLLLAFLPACANGNPAETGAATNVSVTQDSTAAPTQGSAAPSSAAETETTAPATTEPAEPETTVPATTQTATTAAPTETTVLPTTAEVTEPATTTEPTAPSTPAATEVTVPETTVPETTIPETTVPETTVPETTAPHVHSYTTKTVAPTCTKKGYTKYTCACGDTYKDNYKDPVSHSYNRAVTPPTCTEQGYTTYTCRDCGDSYIDDYTDPEHSWGDWELPPVQDSTIQWTCQICGEIKKEFIHQESYDVDPWVPASEDEAAVVQALLKYINQFRAEEGSTQLTYLPGLSQVSQYRSRQLVTHFAHDTHDMREATAYYQYGVYKDFAEAGCPELVEYNYWDDCAREAIGALLGGNYSLDRVGYTLAEAVRESTGHWRYVGSSEYCYVGIGVAYSDGEWFTCIQVSDENYG